MRKEDVLDRAKQLVSNERVKHYGTPKENFTRIATMWSAILGADITPAQVAVCMVALKMTRLIQTPDHEDSWIDLAGYAACGAEVSEKDIKINGYPLTEGLPKPVAHYTSMVHDVSYLAKISPGSDSLAAQNYVRATNGQ